MIQYLKKPETRFAKRRGNAGHHEPDGVAMLQGIPVSPGIGLGSAWLIADHSQAIPPMETLDAALEKIRFDRALAVAATQIEALQATAVGRIGRGQARIFEAHLQVLQDPQLSRDVHTCIAVEGLPAAAALQAVLNRYGERFASIREPYLRERFYDIHDLGQRLIRILSGAAPPDWPGEQPRILIARYLGPAELIQAPPGSVAGFVTENGGTTSHTAIIARSLGIPGITGIACPATVKTGAALLVDGTTGQLIVNPGPDAIAACQAEQRRAQPRPTGSGPAPNGRVQTADGAEIELSVILNGSADPAALPEPGIAGVGLCRTEFLFLHQSGLPSEEEQFAAYREILAAWSGRPVTLRTLDIGGDKRPPALDLAAETNPFLGRRGLRLCLERRDIFATQLRAMLRASRFGRLKIIFPMVGSLEEFRAAQGIFEAEREKLRAAGIGFRENIPVGILIETPAAALLTDLFAREADFFSIGTNDLIQYALAVDRTNPNVARLYDPFHPAVLRLIQTVVAQAGQAGKPVGICGEMAGEPLLLPVLLGLGLREFSLSPASLGSVRKAVAALSRRKINELTRRALELGTGAEVRRFLAESQ